MYNTTPPTFACKIRDLALFARAAQYEFIYYVTTYIVLLLPRIIFR